MQSLIEDLFDHKPAEYTAAHRELFSRFLAALNCGRIRAAEPDPDAPTGWRVNPWVKKGILLGFRMGVNSDMSVGALTFRDKDTYSTKRVDAGSNIRIVPGGSSVRDGVYLGQNVTCMPPMYINVGAYVDDGTMVDSHALVGSCAQVGKNCHISAASQIGGVLEPIGGNCGVYEGTIVKRRAVLGTGTILNRSTPVYDLVLNTIHRASDDDPLVVPEDAVVIAGARAITNGPGKDWGISVYTPVIVKYRDVKTDTRIQLEDLLR
jgi:2,3,4,5-tetrahydropyridine-2-carboxylate N-succinyltransferase